ncbi:MAG: PTS sugar transporter subunit IIA [Candidatus Omnitrophica bacterium]|nr:PTS sugar transporter subunit IIA [Candidatus Omnitrophota bacterium]
MSEYPVMTTKDLAEYLKLNEKTIIKMAQNKELPGVKVGNQWRFHLGTIDQHLKTSSALPVKNEDFNYGQRTSEEILSLSRLTDENLIELNLKAKNKDDLLKKLVKIAVDAGITDKSKDLLEQLKKRETMLTTAIGNGVAVPHLRNPSNIYFSKPSIIIARCVDGIDYNAPDNKKVHLFIMVCAMNEYIHLRLLSNVARLLRSKTFLTTVLEAETSLDILKSIMQHERDELFAS